MYTLFQNYNLILSISSGIISIGAIIYCFVLKSKLNKALYGEADNISESIHNVKKEIERLQNFEDEMSIYLKTVESRLQRSIQSSELIRFNPFQGSGLAGNQSFSLSFVNEKGDGIVVSGLYYSNDRTSMFVKPIKGFSSKHELTTEEKQVVEKSKENLKTK